MNLSSFKRDIDDLIDEFAEGGSTSLTDMKRVWLSKRFSYIYEASPSTNLAFFMQSLYAHSIGYLTGSASFSQRLGGLYCLYCLFETQPFKPPFRVYLSLGELLKLRHLVVNAKENGIKVVPALVKRMLEKNMFLFGSVDLVEGSVAETVNQLTELQNARIQLAYEKLFTNTRIENFLHMDLGMETDVNVLKKLSTEYAEAKKLAIKEASNVVDIQNIKHLSEDKKLVGDLVEKISKDWNVQKDNFYQQTGFGQQQLLQQEQQQDVEGYDQELEQLLLQDQ
ncbi:Small nuclear RNA activating complex (SNAPc), subunit SNAP43 [Quillaja saponaria]|uniref:Small nuclear RNA activating complex (SNAPc), subunit SNAP43 n=1 Tax=Quillaja saponaria TaxID=32244 RepID=A0AAD7VKF6_QUISA|nr:Small nuclear RNA activating complex (SNAPc), subunit SNAP43 [Quillaja saponaria]